ncbi:hypothetical protein N9100_01685 [Gammaproteobacteria bacterium]|nr:hypothetical protein [Gammaproteobacteria bacterium]
MDKRPIRDAIKRQEGIAQQWVEDSIQSSGVDATASMIEDLISMNEIYEGARPVFNQLIDFAIELDSNDIQRGSAKFHAQVRGSADYGSMDSFFIKDGEIHPYDNPDRQPEHINEAEDVKVEPHPLRASWDAVVQRYQDAEQSGDELGMKSAERTLDKLRAQITAAPIATAPPEPVPAPESPDMQREDELDRRLAALPDSGEYTEEQSAELDAITAELDSMDNDPYAADEDYG